VRAEIRRSKSYCHFSKISAALFNLDVDYEDVGSRDASCSVA
jgi:hypothetical protein